MKVTLDYESALWNVLRQLLPGVKLMGCVFHWTQALWRKVSSQSSGGKKLKQSLKSNYRDPRIVQSFKCGPPIFQY